MRVGSEIKPEVGFSNIRLFINYLFFGGIATVVDFGILYSLTEFLGIWYFFSAALSYIVGMFTNYSMNKYFNFRNRSKRIAVQFGLFMTVALIGLALNQVILYALVEMAGLWYMSAKVISVFVVVFWSFYGHKKLTFSILK